MRVFFLFLAITAVIYCYADLDDELSVDTTALRSASANPKEKEEIWHLIAIGAIAAAAAGTAAVGTAAVATAAAAGTAAAVGTGAAATALTIHAIKVRKYQIYWRKRLTREKNAAVNRLKNSYRHRYGWHYYFRPDFNRRRNAIIRSYNGKIRWRMKNYRG